MDEVKIVDTTLRDGQQSLWAYRMRTGAMLPAMEDLDSAGFEAIEFVTPGPQFARMVRDLKEDPWVWLRAGTERARRTPLRIHGSVASRLSPIPRSTQHLMLEKLAGMGIRTTRASDPWNDFDELDETVRMMSEHGIQTILNLVYSVSPRHTVEYFADKAREAASRNPYRICLKDVGGLMTVEAAHQVIPAVVAAVGDVPLEFHAHCTNGLAPYISLLAADYGIRVLHASVPPLADGDSQPSVFDLVRNLTARGYSVDVDLQRLEPVREHLERVRRREDLPAGASRVFDAAIYEHQVPGGMLSNLRFQLAGLGMEHRLPETLDEAARVRADLGYPIMVTPLAQFVGSQAAINVMTGARYKHVTDEIIQYATGVWGKEAAEVMDPDLRADILSRPRAREVVAGTAREPGLEEVRTTYGAELSDEELLTRVFAGVGAGPLDLEGGERIPQTYADYRGHRRSIQDVIRAVDNSRTVTGVYVRRGSSAIEIRR
ncbi:MAG: Oxaloacetate decarboxylase, alpha subunit [Blastococcus sp.]|jgi:oxaloacetate decarboxylase alpha subunit|nr:Oxaloacetate decarboxylase, alpha subunit [Blastococcus sp.]